MSLKLGNTSVNKLYLGDNEVNKAYLGNNLVFDNSIPSGVSYDSVNTMYSLQSPNFTTSWTNALLRLRRSSDNELKYIFANGVGKLRLDSKVRDNGDIFSGGEEVLSDWATTDDVFATVIVGITPDNIINPSKSLGQATPLRQPKFMTSGVIETKGVESVIKFIASSQMSFDSAIVNPILNSGETFTIFVLSYSDSTANQQTVLTTNRITSPNDRVEIYNDRRSNKLASRIRGSGTNYDSVLLAQQNNSNQRVTAIVVTPTNIKTYLDGILQDNTVWSGTFGNNGLRFGSGYNLNNSLDGGIQEVLFYAGDETSNISTISIDIKNRHPII